ncbi:MAG: ATP-binding protein [Rhodocyclales bacterium]|nr:ATP-binding protein [Rhodocyclales bacterium]
MKRFSATDRDERSAFDLVEVVERAVQWVCKAAANQFEVSLNLPASLEVLGSPGQMQQVVMNLVQNAADATENARERRLEILGRGEDGEAVIEFRDSGPGVPAGNLDKLFDPFFTTKPVGRGTGLGLAISYGIVERHGGTLKVSNHPKGGALFTLRLPLAPA